MHKSVKNCRSLNMQTIKLRRSRPSSLAVALALAITMLVVYLLSLQARPQQSTEAASALPGSAQLRMEELQVQFLLDGIHDDETRARVAAAQCARDGGAGLVLPENGRFAVVYEAGGDYSGADAPVIERSSAALTLEIEAPADFIAATSDGLSALRALAAETGALAGALERDETDRRTAAALLNVYRTKLRSSAEGLNGSDPAAVLLRNATEAAAGWLDEAAGDPSPGGIRLVQAAACREWINLSANLARLSGK